DSALIESASMELRKQFDSLGKPLAFVLVTHGHPDHYNGLTQLTARMNVDIISTPQTDRVIRESDLLYQGARTELDPGALEAALFIVTAIVPPRLLTHALIFRVLTKHSHAAAGREDMRSVA